ncbi:STAS domain-containing protein [Saccharothrix yanglingensis]|uniref:STAS domain-containing protein n=1 Tax=Saccharothrix yanglingensis TaxID=659496 RepID=UPI0027D21933|nr:STAS domain-containing protein [Saccharothrix yanglingensis]
MGAIVQNSDRPPPAVALPPSGRPPAFAVVARPLSSSTLVCAVTGEVDLATAPRLRALLAEQIRLEGPDLVVDLGEVHFFSAAGLNVLVDALAAADAAGVGFCVVARTRRVLVPLSVTGLDLVFAVYPHVDGVPARGDGPGPASVRSAAVRLPRARPARSPDSPVADLP